MGTKKVDLVVLGGGPGGYVASEEGKVAVENIARKADISYTTLTKLESNVVKRPSVQHKVLLMLVYSAGLRVGEVVKLRPEDIDSKRMLIHVKDSKG